MTTNMQGDFTTIPTLDLSLANSAETKPLFLSELRTALVRVGFFYVKNHGIPDEVQQDAIEQSIKFFELPLEEKLEIETVHSKHFLGYNRMSSEKTLQQKDQNESIAIGAELPAPNPSDPIYLNLQGPSQWPSTLPTFQPAIEAYRTAVSSLASTFTPLIEAALSLPPSSLTTLFNDNPFSRLKITSYPPPTPSPSLSPFQGVGPHKDGAFMTYLLQGTRHNSLEVQNHAGAWIPVPPVPGTLVVNIGRVLELLTGGVCAATTHRVLLEPEGFRGLGPRLSLPFFQHVNLKLRGDELRVEVPPGTRELSGEAVVSDAGTFFGGLVDGCVGDLVFVSMMTSFQEAARRWYPDLLERALVTEEVALRGTKGAVV
ncbi:2OG-Fe(II) oxygenase superfamily [Lasiosphaeria hispida]|uniref:2OG-Fe(II) oxygenase superfamily n=1 Tax=Lasiosphaeria hispida TaxID=260671 RepID=A0AAJ0MF21_9PEZI|nr:2OG-Fe(II) oxygenase superfamily [Lasiosphaeria hispida]